MTDTAIICEDVEGFGKLIFCMAPFLFLNPHCNHSTRVHRHNIFLDDALTGIEFFDC